MNLGRIELIYFSVADPRVKSKRKECTRSPAGVLATPPPPPLFPGCLAKVTPVHSDPSGGPQAFV